MPTIDIACGKVTESSAWVRGKVSGASVRLAVASYGNLAAPFYFGPVSPSDDIASVEATGLAPDTRYQYAFEVDGTLDLDIKGEFVTDPPIGTPTSFKIVGGSCIDGRYDGDPGSIYSQTELWELIVPDHRDARRYINTGDLHYLDNTANVEGNYLTAYSEAFGSTLRHMLTAVPIVYTWDDHDYGNNNSWGPFTGRDAVQTAYRKRVPHYDLPAGSGANPIWHSFQIGRVLFIVSDTRSERTDPAGTDNSSKTMLGAAQKAWFIDLLQTTDAAAVVWVNSSPWIAASSAVVDSWGQYTTERAQLVPYIESYMQRGAFCIFAGDIHCLAIDDGTNNTWGGFPIFSFAAQDGEGNYRGGPYSHGRVLGNDRYGTLEFEDDGNGISITGTGYIRREAWRSHRFAFPAGYLPAGRYAAGMFGEPLRAA